MATLSEQLDAMRRLRPNWDGYNADPPEPHVIAWAKDFVDYFEALERVQGVKRNIRVYPTRIGGVQIEWEDSRFERELELNPDGSIELLHVDKATGAMREETFRPGREAVAPGFLHRLGEMATEFVEAA
jgi:hypothetical protein